MKKGGKDSKLLVVSNPNIFTTTANCFKRLNSAGLLTHFKESTEDGILVCKTDRIPIEVLVECVDGKTQPVLFYERSLVTPNIITGGWFYKQLDSSWVINPNPIISPEGRVISLHDINIMIGRSKSAFWHLNNLWARFGYKLTRLSLSFGFMSTTNKGSDLVFTGIVDDKFWELETPLRVITTEEVDGCVYVCMPELSKSQKEELKSKALSSLNGRSQSTITIQKPGWQRIVTVDKNSKGWYIVFPAEKGSDLINGQEGLLQKRIETLKNGEKSTIVIKDHSYDGNVIIRKDDVGRIILFVGNLPNFTNDQVVNLDSIIEDPGNFQSQDMLIGKELASDFTYEILVIKSGEKIIVVPQYVFNTLEVEEAKKLLAILKTGEWGTIVFPETTIPLTDLSQIAEFSKQFFPDSPSNNK